MTAGDRLSYALALLAVAVGVGGLVWTVTVDEIEGLQTIGLGGSIFVLAIVAAWR